MMVAWINFLIKPDNPPPLVQGFAVYPNHFSVDRNKKICLNDYFLVQLYKQLCGGDVMTGISNLLKKSIIFKTLEEADIQRITPLFEKRELSTGDILATAGDRAQYFFILEKGTLLLALEDGKSIVLDTPGDFIAMDLLSAMGRYKSTITALEDGLLFIIPRKFFLEFIQEDTPGAAAVMKAWQGFLDQTAPFVKKIEENHETDVPAIF